MNKYMVRREGEISEADILVLIDEHKLNILPRLEVLKDYYLGTHDILKRQYEAYKPDARLVNSFPSYITQIASSYFMGTPINYSTEDKQLSDLLNDVLRYNDAADMDVKHAENLSIYGTSFELLYIDKDSQIDTRIAVIEPTEMFVVYDYALEPNPIAAIRYYNDAEGKLKVEYYDTKIINYYSAASGALVLNESIEHFFGDVPVVQYINNNDWKGDFENVISLIDEYNGLQSDTANDFAYFTDAYLFLSGAEIDEENATNMRNNRIINITDPDAKASWLVKNIQDTALENYKNRIVNDIHKFSAVPNLTDEAFAGNLSGVAIKYKLLGLENLANLKERKFKKGIQRRLELLLNLFYTRGLSEMKNYMDIILTFKRTLPANLAEEAEIARNLQGIVSTETLLANLSIIDDAAAEIEKINNEKANSNPLYSEAFTANEDEEPKAGE